jgi:hypothetical protein
VNNDALLAIVHNNIANLDVSVTFSLSSLHEHFKRVLH